MSFPNTTEVTNSREYTARGKLFEEMRSDYHWMHIRATTHTHVHTHMHTCTHTHTHTHTHMHTHTHTHTCTCTIVHIHIHTPENTPWRREDVGCDIGVVGLEKKGQNASHSGAKRVSCDDQSVVLNIPQKKTMTNLHVLWPSCEVIGLPKTLVCS